MTRVAVLCGLGLHCHTEALAAYREVGAAAELVEATALIAGTLALTSYDLVHFSGGFSFGAVGGAGQQLAEQLRSGPGWPVLRAWLEQGGRAVGVCNGMQILTAAGLLPNLAGTYTPEVALEANVGGLFVDRWVRCTWQPPGTPLHYLELPVRHAEGRVVPFTPEIALQIEALGLPTLRYVDHLDEPSEAPPHNPAGSPMAVAGLLSANGRVLGLMPHPEAAMSPFQHPAWPQRQRWGDLPEFGDGATVLRWLVGPFVEEGKDV